MEFYRTLPINTDEKTLQKELTLKNLALMTNEMFVIEEQNKRKTHIGSLWGEFTLTRGLIRGGLRFALAECPNALAWTITTGLAPDPELVVVHLTINRQKKELSFVEEIHAFLDDHCICLQKTFG
jgi:hypothetical protein